MFFSSRKTTEVVFAVMFPLFSIVAVMLSTSPRTGSSESVEMLTAVKSGTEPEGGFPSVRLREKSPLLLLSSSVILYLVVLTFSPSVAMNTSTSPSFALITVWKKLESA